MKVGRERKFTHRTLRQQSIITTALHWRICAREQLTANLTPLHSSDLKRERVSLVHRAPALSSPLSAAAAP